MVQISELRDAAALDAAAVIDIYAANGWGGKQDYDPAKVRGWFGKSTCVLLAHDEAGELMGWVRALSDGLDTWLNEIIVRPDQQGKGIGTALMRAAVDRFKTTAIYGDALNGTETFFAKFGLVPRKRMVAVSRAPQAAA